MRFSGALVLWCCLWPGCSDDATPADAGPPDLPASPDARPPDASPPDGEVDAGADGLVPFALELTVNDIPAAMNGSAPFTNLAGQTEPFRLAVPRDGFSIDVRYKGSTAKPDTLVLTADVPLGAGTSRVKAGENLAAKLTPEAGGATLLVRPELKLPVGTATFTAQMSDGETTHEVKLALEVVEKTFLLDPFRLEDPWLLVFSQDNYTISKSQDAGGKLVLASEATPNGVADFDEDLRLIGLGTAQMLPDAAAAANMGVVGTNAIVRAWIQQELLAALRQVYARNKDGTANADSVNIRFFVEGQPGAPVLADYQDQLLAGGETVKSFSAIAIGGGDLAKGYIGLSKVDLRNVRNEADIGPTYGVFTTRAIALILELAATDATIQLLLTAFMGAFIPELGQGGQPVGEHVLDAEILAAGFDPAKASSAAADRYNKLAFLVETLGRLAGALTGHEIGHAVGLVADGPPPQGLFGGEKNAVFVNPASTNSFHIDTPGFNVMQAGPGSAPGVPFQAAEFLTLPSFNELNLAYLRGRVLLLP